MFLVGIMSWWYGAGLKGQLQRIRDRLAATAGLFSIGQLFATLFSPFRQISAGGTNGPVGVQLQAFLEKTLSRGIGAIVRIFTIVAGIVTLTVQFIGEIVVLLMWVALPILPVVGIIMFAIGWVPKWM